MKQYVIDELRPVDYQKLKDHLASNFTSADIGGIYWIELEEALLSEVQTAHKMCRPFYFVVDLEPQIIACELLIRTHNRVCCECIAYANEVQRDWIIGFIDDLFEKLELKT